MARPNDYPYWATQNEVDPVYGTNNKEMPSTEKKDYGQRGNKNTLRQDINYLFNLIREWIQFFDEQYAIGDVYFTDNSSGQAPDELTLSEQLGGTWEYIDRGQGGSGDDTIAGVAVKVYEKINEVNL